MAELYLIDCMEQGDRYLIEAHIDSNNALYEVVGCVQWSHSLKNDIGACLRQMQLYRLRRARCGEDPPRARDAGLSHSRIAYGVCYSLRNSATSKRIRFGISERASCSMKVSIKWQNCQILDLPREWAHDL